MARTLHLTQTAGPLSFHVVTESLQANVLKSAIDPIGMRGPRTEER